MNLTSIKVKTLDLDQIDLYEKYRNKNLLILFYNNDCLGCTGRALPLAYQMNQEFPELEVLAIHSNFNKEVSKQQILDIFTTKKAPFPIYIDENHQVYNQFNCEGTPHWLIIDKSGVLIKSFFGSQEGSQSRMYYALTELTT